MRYLFLVPGVLMLLGGIGIAARTLVFHRSALKAQALVVGNEAGSGEEGAIFHAVFEFTSLDGRRHRVVSGTGSNPASFEVGEVVPVIYDGNRPEKATINTFSHQYFGALVSCLLGIVFTLMGAIPLYLRAVQRAES